MRRGRLCTGYRRRMLATGFAEACDPSSGLVVDLGEEQVNRRGSFRPPERPGLQPVRVYTDKGVAPDIIAAIARVPVADYCAAAARSTWTISARLREDLQAVGTAGPIWFRSAWMPWT